MAQFFSPPRAFVHPDCARKSTSQATAQSISRQASAISILSPPHRSLALQDLGRELLFDAHVVLLEERA